MATVQLANPSVGALFAVPESNWTAISKRVGITILASAIAPIIGRTLNEFPKLETACQLWQATTFPGLTSLSASIGSFATTAANALTALQAPISSLSPNDPVPATTAELVKTTLGNLANGMAPLNTQCNQLDTQVQGFANENQIVDAQVEAYIKYLGPNWQSLAGYIPPVESAVGLVQGTWQAIASDFNAVAGGSISITTALLLSLDLQSAILAWKNLGPQASAFASLAQDQQQYLSGAWLTAGR